MKEEVAENWLKDTNRIYTEEKIQVANVFMK